MKINDMIPKRFLTRDDVGEGVLGTIERVFQMNVAPEGADPEMKYVLQCAELPKPLVLNSTNIHTIASITGSDETDSWKGKQIVLFNDANVSFAGKVVGGIRVRAKRESKEQLPF